MKRIILVVALVLIVLVAAGGGAFWWMMQQPLYTPGMVRSAANLRAPLAPPTQATRPESSRWWTVEADIQLHHYATGSGTNVLVVHGGPGAPFAAPIAALAPLTGRFAFHYYDQRGCGTSTRPIDRFTSTNYYENMQAADKILGLGAQIADIERARRILGDDRIILVGHSFGGFLAALYAAEFPEHVRALVLIAPAEMLVMPPASGGLFEQVRPLLPDEMKTEYDAYLKRYLDFGSIFAKSDADLVALNAQFARYYTVAARRKGVCGARGECRRDRGRRVDGAGDVPEHGNAARLSGSAQGGDGAGPRLARRERSPAGEREPDVCRGVAQRPVPDDPQRRAFCIRRPTGGICHGGRPLFGQGAMIREIEARTLLSSAKHPDPWFGIKYTMNLYRGCQHQCIYCDSRSACYRIENFKDVLVKRNALDLLRHELAHKRVKGVVGTGSMNDPYMPLERERNLTGRALALLAEYGYPVHIITKSDGVVRDLDTLCEIARVYATVSFSITTIDDALCKKVEPGAPVSSQRLAAMKTLSAHGVQVGLTLMPVLPFLEDAEENITGLVAQAHAAGARYILAAFGMTLREGSRDYYYAQLDLLFPGLRARYEKTFGDRYECSAPNAARLEKVFRGECAHYGIATRVPPFEPATAAQMRLL